MEPVTPEEWAEAVDGAVFYAALEASRQYGLVSGGPEVDVERCEEVLRRARALGVAIPSVAEVIDRYQSWLAVRR